MGDATKLFAKKKAERGPLVGSGMARPLSPEEKERGSLFLRRKMNPGAVKPKPMHLATQVSTEKAPPASAPTAVMPDAPEIDEEGSPVVDKMAEDVEPVYPDGDASSESLAVGVDLQEKSAQGHFAHPEIDTRDFQPFEKVASQGSIYQSERPHPIDLFKSLSKDFKKLEWAGWVQENVWRAIREKTGAGPSEVVRNMVGAFQAILNSEAFWEEHHAFLWIAQALNGEVPDFSDLPELSPEQIIFAMHVVGQIRGQEPIRSNGVEAAGVHYGDQVIATIAVIFHMAGLLCAPWTQDGVNDQIRRLQDPAAQAMSREVEQAWGRLVTKLDAGERPKAESFDSGDPRDLQLARLTAIWEYVNNPHAE